MENESIRDKNLRLMREALDAKNYARKKIDQFKGSQSKKSKSKAVKDQQFLARAIRISEDPEDLEKNLKS